MFSCLKEQTSAIDDSIRITGRALIEKNLKDIKHTVHLKFVYQL